MFNIICKQFPTRFERDIDVKNWFLRMLLIIINSNYQNNRPVGTL